MTWTPPVREDLQGQKPYGAPQLDVPVRLNTNENPFPPSAALAEAVGRAAAAAATSLNRYPDREAWALRESLAAYLLAESGVAVDPAMVWAANGSNEVMQHVFAAFGGPDRLAMGFSPTYSMYDQYARDTFTRYRTVGRRADFGLDAAMVVAAMIGGSPDILILTSPNNPTGTALTLDVVSAACAMATGVVVVDEAYAEFRRPGTPSALICTSSSIPSMGAWSAASNAWVVFSGAAAEWGGREPAGGGGEAALQGVAAGDTVRPRGPGVGASRGRALSASKWALWRRGSAA